MYWIVLFIIIAFAVRASQIQKKDIISGNIDYRKDMGIQLVVLGILIALVPSTMWFTPFELWSPSSYFIFDEEHILSIAIPVCSINLILSFTNIVYKNSDLLEKDSIMALPVSMLPSTQKGLLTFTAFILLSVVFEEVVFRQILFGLLYNTMGLHGWSLIVGSTAIFALGHLYQGVARGLIGSGLMGVLLASVFLIKESLWWPIALHAANNSAVVVYAARRLYASKNRAKKNTEE